MASRAPQRSCASPAICPKTRSAISGYASYSSRTTAWPWFDERTVPVKLTTAPQSVPSTACSGASGAIGSGPMRCTPVPPETGGMSATSQPSRSLRSGCAKS